MKNPLAAFLILSATGALSLRAEVPIDLPWNTLCGGQAFTHRLIVTTDQGETVDGYCVSINVNEIVLRTGDNKPVKIARSALTRIQMHRIKGGHELASLGKGMRTGFAEGLDLLLSPYAPAGLVMLPATVAWGAVAAPFCVLGDLRHKLVGNQDVHVY
jgi:hypothetical protein